MHTLKVGFSSSNGLRDIEWLVLAKSPLFVQIKCLCIINSCFDCGLGKSRFRFIRTYSWV